MTDYRGAVHYKWKGGRFVRGGYVVVQTEGHPRANNGYVAEHLLVAEAALGRFLRPPEQVHHFNEIKTDNSPGNLVVCPDRAYHALLHQRQRALAACGHAHWRKCGYCLGYDDPANLRIVPKEKQSTQAYHLRCSMESQRKRKAAIRKAALDRAGILSVNVITSDRGRTK